LVAGRFGLASNTIECGFTKIIFIFLDSAERLISSAQRNITASSAAAVLINIRVSGV
jgi:hypothetical protein